MNGNVGLVDFDLGLDDRQVRDREQHGAGVVHGADHRRFALLDVAARDDAGDRRRRRAPCSGRSCALSRFASSCLMRCSCVLALCSADQQVRRLPRHVVHARARTGRAGSRPALNICSCRFSVSSASFSATFELSICALRLLQLRLRGRRGWLRGSAPCVSRFFASIWSSSWPFVTMSPSRTSSVDDLAHRLRADVHRALRLDLAAGRHDGLEVACLDLLDVDGDARLPLQAQVGVRERRRAPRPRPTPDDHFFFRRHSDPDPIYP